MEHPDRGDDEAYRRYFAGMDASMDQKAAFLSAHLNTDAGARILDLGCGSGALSARLAALAPRARVTGIDIDADSIRYAKETYTLPNVEFAVGDATAAWPEVDAAVSCSLLHHVYTYAKRPYDDAAVAAALAAHVASLRPGGLLVLRDFCVDGAPDETCLLELPEAESEPEAEAGTLRLLRDFARRARPLDPAGSGFPLEDLGSVEAGWRRFRLHRHWSAEFLLRKDYGDDWEAELREQYAFWPLRRFADTLEGLGARVLRAAPVRNDWVVRNRFAGRARRRDERGRLLPWPATNMVILAQRVSPGRALRLREQRLDDAAPSYLQLTGWQDGGEQGGGEQGGGEQADLVRRPTGAVDFLPYAIVDDRVRVLVRSDWPRPASVMMSRGGEALDEIRSGHVVEMISLASDGADPGGDFQARTGLAPGTLTGLLDFLPSAGLVAERVQGLAVAMTSLPARMPAPAPPGQALQVGTLQSFDALGLLRAAEVGMLVEARLELTIRCLLRRLGREPGRWIGEPVVPPSLDAAADAWDALDAAAGTPFAPAEPAGYLRLVRSIFSDVPAGGAPGAQMPLEMAVPARHGAWTVSVLAVAQAGGARAGLAVGIERQRRPAAQLAFGDAGLLAIPAWRIEQLPDAPDPLRAAAAAFCGCPEERLTRLGGAYYPSLGLTPERVQPFAVPAEALPPARRDALLFVTLPSLLEAAAEVRDGHLLIAAFRLAAALQG